MVITVVMQPNPFGYTSAAGKINESYITTNQLENDNFSLMFKHVFNVPLIAVCFQQSWKMLQIQHRGVVSKLISLRAGLISAINVSMFQRRGGFFFFRLASHVCS